MLALFATSLALASRGGPNPCSTLQGKRGCPDDVSALCQPASSKPNWPIFHLFDNVTRLKDGKLYSEGLNDINAIFKHRGLYHVMNQAGGGDWTNAVSSDLVHWAHLPHALKETKPSKTWHHDWGGPCDGSLSFPDLGFAPYNGSTPVIMYGPDCRCTRARAVSSHCGRFLPLGADGEPLYELEVEVGSGDAARIEVAWPASDDPYLRQWTKTVPGPVTFDGVPCSFPGRVWKSKNTLGGKPYWNQICALNATWPWARYMTTDPKLMSWTRADGEFVNGIPLADSNRSRCNGASLFHKIPGGETAGPGGAPLYMISANSGSEMYVGTYDSKAEAMTVFGKRQILDSSFPAVGNFTDGQGNYIWAAAGTQGPDPETDTGRLITGAWVRGGGSGRVPCMIDGGCQSVVSLIRSISWDAASKQVPLLVLFRLFFLVFLLPWLLTWPSAQLVSFPVGEYTTLRNRTFFQDQRLSVPTAAGGKPGVARLSVPPETGSLDVLASFELPAKGASGFGVSVRSGDVRLEVVSAVATAAGHVVVVNFYAGPQPCVSVRGQPPCTASPTPPPPTNATLEVLRGETLDVRMLVDRPIVEIFVNGGRAAFVSADANFSSATTDVSLFNNNDNVGVTASSVSAFEMGCGWATELPKPS